MVIYLTGVSQKQAGACGMKSDNNSPIRFVTSMFLESGEVLHDGQI